MEMGSFFSNPELEKELFIAIYGNKIGEVKQILEKRVNINVKVSSEHKTEKIRWELYENGDTPLIFSLKCKHYEIARLLINSNADINICNDRGLNALMISIYDKSYEFSRFLLNFNVDVTEINKNRETIFHILARSNDYKICELALSKLNKKKSEEVLNRRNFIGDLALTLSVAEGNEKISLLYVKNGANPFLKDIGKKSAYDHAEDSDLRKQILRIYNEFLNTKSKRISDENIKFGFYLIN